MKLLARRAPPCRRPRPAGTPGRASHSSAWETASRAAGPTGWQSVRPCRCRPPGCRNSSWRRRPARPGRPPKTSPIARASSASQLRVLSPWAWRWPTSSGVARRRWSTARQHVDHGPVAAGDEPGPGHRTGSRRQHLAVDRRAAGLGRAKSSSTIAPGPFAQHHARAVAIEGPAQPRGIAVAAGHFFLLEGVDDLHGVQRVPVAPTSMASALPRRMIWKASPRARLAAASRMVSELFGPRRSL